MTWLVWRQHRTDALFALGALAVFVLVAALTGVHMAGTYHAALHSCAATGSCDSVGDHLFSGDGAIIDLINLTVIVPVLIGVFWGAPLLAREVEQGTHKLIWTQTVTRRRWLAGNVVAILAAATFIGVALTVTVTWWSRTFDLIGHNRFQPGHFDVQGIVPVAYALFGATLGLAAGALLRRTLAALAATVGVMVALRVIVVNYVRPHYVTAVTKLVSLTAASSGVDGSSWPLHTHIVDSKGINVTDNGNLVAAMPNACRRLIGPGRVGVESCLDRYGYRMQIMYQPANRFWTFQVIESGIFVALAVVLVGAAFVLVQRDA